MTPKVALVLLLKYLGMLQTVLLEVGLEMLTPVARHAYLLLQIPPVVLPATLNSQPLLVPLTPWILTITRTPLCVDIANPGGRRAKVLLFKLVRRVKYFGCHTDLHCTWST